MDRLSLQDGRNAASLMVTSLCRLAPLVAQKVQAQDLGSNPALPLTAV